MGLITFNIRGVEAVNGAALNRAPGEVAIVSPEGVAFREGPQEPLATADANPVVDPLLNPSA